MISLSGDVADDVATLRRWLGGPDGVPLVVETSGSTGRPKRVLLSRGAVLASVAATEQRLGGAGRWRLLLPSSYVAGVQVICRALVAGHDPVLAEEGWPDGQGWFVSLVPTQLHRMLGDPAERDALRRAGAVLLGGGPIDRSLRARAESEGVSVVATYGSAETAGGCVYDGMPLDGVTVDLEDDSRIRIHGPTLFEGYDGDPELTARTLVDGWFRTSDAGRLDADGRLVVLGRVDDVVVTGGVNVPTPVVAARLRAHRAVVEAEVVGVPDEEWGARLVAFVVAGPGAPAPGLDELRDWVGERHPRAWAPRRVVLLEEIPLLGNGKPDRLALRRLG